MKDIAPELLETLKKAFKIKFDKNKNIKELNKRLLDGVATYKEANLYSMEIGDMLAEVYKENLSTEILPQGIMHYNIAQRTVAPTMVDNYELVSTYAQEVQGLINAEHSIGIKPIKATLNQSRIDGIINRLSSDEFEAIKWILDEPIKNFTQAVVDDTVKENAEFHAKSGLHPKIVRKEFGNCCDWCKEKVGVYEYPDEVPEDVYRRHRYCRCTVDYLPGDGRKQNAHTKVWVNKLT